MTQVEQQSSLDSQKYDRELTEFDRHLVVTYYRRGKTNLKLKNYAAALQDFDAAIKLEPKNVKDYLIRG